MQEESEMERSICVFCFDHDISQRFSLIIQLMTILSMPRVYLPQARDCSYSSISSHSVLVASILTVSILIDIPIPERGSALPDLGIGTDGLAGAPRSSSPLVRAFSCVGTIDSALI